MTNLPPIIDMHTHIWGGTSDADGDTLIEMANRFNLEAVVVMPLFGGTCPSPADIAAGNQAVAALAKRDPRMKPMEECYRPATAVGGESRRRARRSLKVVR